MSKSAWHFNFDGRTLVAIEPASTLQLPVDDWNEIGIAITQDDLSGAGFSLVINRPAQNLCIPSDSPIFRALLERFCMLEGFEWHRLVNARSNPSEPYTVCWRRRVRSSMPFSSSAFLPGFLLASFHPNHIDLDALAQAFHFAAAFVATLAG